MATCITLVFSKDKELTLVCVILLASNGDSLMLGGGLEMHFSRSCYFWHVGVMLHYKEGTWCVSTRKELSKMKQTKYLRFDSASFTQNCAQSVATYPPIVVRLLLYR